MSFGADEQKGIQDSRSEVEKVAVEQTGKQKRGDAQPEEGLFRRGAAEKEDERLRAVEGVGEKGEDPPACKQLHKRIVRARGQEGVGRAGQKIADRPVVEQSSRRFVKSHAEQGAGEEFLPARRIDFFSAFGGEPRFNQRGEQREKFFAEYDKTDDEGDEQSAEQNEMFEPFPPLRREQDDERAKKIHDRAE